MDADPTRKRVLVAQGLAALAYFFCVHGAHAATAVHHVHPGPGPAHAVAVVRSPL
jgi:hypothetical protein